MKIKETMADFYKNEIEAVYTPPCPDYSIVTRQTPVTKHAGYSRLLNIGLAALIALAFIPLGNSAFKPSELAHRAAQNCRTYGIDSKITFGIMQLNLSVSKSISQGGIK